MSFAADAARPGRTRAVVFETRESPPPVCPDGQGDYLDLGVAPGLVRWQVIRFEPEFELGMHHADTLDFDMVLEGSVEIVLDDGAHWLGPGDCVVVTGVDHAWKAGPDGFVLSVTTIGTPPKR
jgi:quercetin dioxygenase-like cupin family protein